MSDFFDNDGAPSEKLTDLIAALPPEAILKQTKNVMWSMVQFKEMQMMYSCVLKEIRTKFEVLNSEFELRYKRNPIYSINTRLKRLESIASKLIKYKAPFTLESVEKNVNDFAGIRVVCSYIDDIYKIADALLQQDDVTLIAKKDYIKNPKPNGYRSLHLIIEVPVFFSGEKKAVKAEVQIRTIAMDYWASLEHQIKYKKEIPEQVQISGELKKCAEIIAQTDEKMLDLRKRIEAAEDAPTEEDILLEKLRRIDTPIK